MPHHVLRVGRKTSKASYADLAELDRAEIGAAQSQARLPPLRDAPRLLACHDFQGGYSEDPQTQGYSFEHWAYADVYVYFSHQRVSLPPAEYVHAAHRHGTRILGTLIFEWDEARADLRRLLDGSKPQRSKFREPLSFEYADKLIALAAANGIDGFLVNIEVALNLQGLSNVYLNKLDAMHNAGRLRRWVEYLRTEGEKHIKEWHVVWYDSVTYPHGHLAWQDAMTPANAPFFRAAHGGFTNYTWTGPEFNPTKLHPALVASAAMADANQYKRADVYTGIDVFGRNCHGGHDTWKALELIGPRRAYPAAERSLGLSVALFAPGWTWESNAPGPTRSWADWWEDDCRFWLVGPHAVARHFDARPVLFNGLFRTNFALGTGIGWYVRGELAFEGPWSDASVSAPKPDLAWPTVQYVCTPSGDKARCTVTSSFAKVAWSGTGALQLDVPAGSWHIPLLALEVPETCAGSATMRLTVHGAAASPCILRPHAASPKSTSTKGPHGWTQCAAQITLVPGTVHVGVAIEVQEACSVLVGQLDVDQTPMDDVYEALWSDRETLTWPAFAPEGYEIFAVSESPAWLGTVPSSVVHIPPALAADHLLEIRRIGAWPEEPVAYS